MKIPKLSDQVTEKIKNSSFLGFIKKWSGLAIGITFVLIVIVAGLSKTFKSYSGPCAMVATIKDRTVAEKYITLCSQERRQKVISFLKDADLLDGATFDSILAYIEQGKITTMVNTEEYQPEEKKQEFWSRLFK